MAKKYAVNSRVKFANRVMTRLIRWNLAPPRSYLMTVRGRKTGKLYTTPVTLVEREGRRWLVAPYGEVSWVKNARAAGEVSLFRNRKSETLALQELGPWESAAILKEYIAKQAIVRPFFDVSPDAPLEEFEREASHHPVFLLRPIPFP